MRERNRSPELQGSPSRSSTARPHGTHRSVDRISHSWPSASTSGNQGSINGSQPVGPTTWSGPHRSCPTSSSRTSPGLPAYVKLPRSCAASGRPSAHPDRALTEAGSPFSRSGIERRRVSGPRACRRGACPIRAARDRARPRRRPPARCAHRRHHPSHCQRSPGSRRGRTSSRHSLSFSRCRARWNAQRLPRERLLVAVGVRPGAQAPQAQHARPHHHLSDR